MSSMKATRSRRTPLRPALEALEGWALSGFLAVANEDPNVFVTGPLTVLFNDGVWPPQPILPPGPPTDRPPIHAPVARRSESPLGVCHFPDESFTHAGDANLDSTGQATTELDAIDKSRQGRLLVSFRARRWALNDAAWDNLFDTEPLLLPVASTGDQQTGRFSRRW
jgi:hypothetical protein